MATLYVDGKAVNFNPGDNLLQAVLNAGLDASYFCYHPALGNLGACRLCAMQLAPEKAGQQPRTVMSCMEPAREGMQVSLEAAQAKGVRESVIEFLMTNHPHDCPVCDEGGECDLQDMTVVNSHPYRRYSGTKRTFRNQYLGPLVTHNMDRCITCYRCVRFYQDYALGDDLGALGSRNQVYFGRSEDGPFNSPFAGNIIELCPTGVFNDKVFHQRYSRVWDLTTAPSICAHCSVGCNIEPAARAGTLRRVRNRYHEQLNRYFICDRGRYGHRYTEQPERPLTAKVDGQTLALAEAYQAVVKRLQAAQGIAGLGSGREGLATNVALRLLLEKLAGHCTAYSSHWLEQAVTQAAYANRQAPSLAQMEQADVVLVVGDLTSHGPMMDLAVRQVINRANTQVLVLDCNKSDLARHAQQHLMLAPQQLLAALQQLATGLAQSQSNKKVKRNKKDQGLDQPLNDWLAILQQARQPLLLGVAETQGYAGVSALQQLAEGLGDQAQVAFALPEANSFSCALLTQPGDTEAVLNAIDAGQADTLIVIGADPLGDQLGADRWAKVRDKIKQLIVFDCIATKTVESADCFIPLAAWPERNGMFINYEGRVQAFRQVNRRQQPLPSGLDALLVIAEQLALPTQQPLAELVSEQINDLIEVPQAGGLGNKVKSEAIDHLAAKTTPWVAGDDKQGSEPTEAWQADLHSWYGEDSLARFAPELASLAPAQGVRMCQTLAKEAQLKAGQLIRVMGPEGELTLPLVPVKTMASHTLALSRSALSGLGLYPGDKVQWQAQDNITRVELTAD